ncbi:exodeoxyribonuclease VII small subunit [Sphingomonadaceae bacterium G21617-S1]|jgi:exodeoxyribonuclease VII small subunit|uniref:exodeoxyribonuclease VII small subunit n=1 Tax=Rhizorhabdus sp. TaxID=1968843 RepID=UPI0012151B16|nr:exodeoxyribonuclease VII small subunit [Rhizorhabdus sp.]MBD3761314.1 exodeoxyribonuclease VII small subunit [Rhizorhabdus sp.]MCZ4340917.1 exodeoxyribonuclease VII small subunit [Sphingomonadaceae bacterium G21617-S1]TAK07285.1 MAG: exodeoxyribonuclease VII small subunit [Rhizorhabdus sp.]
MTDADSLTDLSFEEALKQLEAIVRQLESGDVPLDESITLYAKGDALRRRCEERLKAAQARIEKISLGADGAPRGTEPFDAG